jgi:prepilin-type N-terminal cleavage/methylation domain-containing protein
LILTSYYILQKNRGVAINSKLKAQNSKLKNGYTLIEMVVVMGIITVIFSFGTLGLTTIRNQYILDGMTEDTVTMIREAQTRAISVSGGAKAWGVSYEAFAPNRIILLKAMDINTTPVVQIHEFKNLATGASITGGLSGTRSVFYVAPFGTPYIAKARPSCVYPADWALTQKATREVKPQGNCISTENELRLTITYKGRSSVIIVNKSGDARVE